MKTFLNGVLSLVVILTILVAPQIIIAQNPWSLEIRGGLHNATQELGDADIGTGLGFEATITYSFMPNLGAYTGWGWNNFNADQSFKGSDIDFEETGYTFGLQYMNSCQSLNFDYLIRAGGIYNHIEVENNEGDIVDDSGHGLGWQAGAGLMIPFVKNWTIIPSVRYRALSSELEDGNENIDVDLTYISGGIGFSWSF
ncbi:MAG: porin family protein [Candidatus Marinimicrobia bacterium]|nr:porin family protein [Candidatus Neomarinimicrobiota bacterium]